MGHPWPCKAFAASLPLNPKIPAMLGHAKGVEDQKQRARFERTRFAILSRALDFLFPLCVSLADACKARDVERELLKAGIDSGQQRKLDKLAKQ